MDETEGVGTLETYEDPTENVPLSVAPTKMPTFEVSLLVAPTKTPASEIPLPVEVDMAEHVTAAEHVSVETTQGEVVGSELPSQPRSLQVMIVMF